MEAESSAVRAPASWRRSLPAIALIVMGVALAAAGVAEIWVGAVAERVSDLVRFELSDEGLAQHRADFEAAQTVVTGAEEDVLPTIAATLGVTNEEIDRRVAEGYPAVDRMLREWPQIEPLAESSLLNLEAQQGRFEEADSVPTGWLPSYAGGIWNLFLAAVVLAAGVVLAMARRPVVRRAAAAVPVAIAALLIVLPLALGIPGKSADADTVLDSLNPSDDVVVRTQEAFAVSEAGAREFDEKLLPDVAAGLGVSREVLDLSIANAFPEVAAGLEQLPAATERYEARVAIRTNGADDLATLKDIPIAELGWFGPAFGGLLAVVGGVAAFAVWRRTGYPDTASPHAAPEAVADESPAGGR